MKEYQARAVIEALKRGKQFVFESYSADAREVLAYDRAANSFALTTFHAYDASVVDTRVFVEIELTGWLIDTFAYRDFK